MKKRFTFLILLVVSIIMSTMVIYADTSTDYDESVYAKHKPILKIDESSFPNEMVRRAVLKRYDMNRDGYLSQYEMEDPTSFSVDAADIQETDGYKYGRQVYQDEKYRVIDFSSYETIFKKIKFGKNAKLKKLSIDGSAYCINKKIRKLDISKMKNLRYLYLQSCTKLKEIKMSKKNNKKLKKIEIYGCGKFKKSSLDKTQISKKTKVRVLTW